MTDVDLMELPDDCTLGDVAEAARQLGRRLVSFGQLVVELGGLVGALGSVVESLDVES